MDGHGIQLIRATSPEWRNLKHAEHWESSLREYAYPIIGRLQVRHVTRTHIVEILEPI